MTQDGSNRRILVVEDSETQALKLRYLLEDGGWEVRGAATAEAALGELNRQLPALIVADSSLPGIERIRAHGVPILMLTPGPDEGRDPESGADEHLSKSAPFEVLLSRIRTLVRKAGPAQPAPAAPQSSTRRARLLAVDDSPTYLGHLAEVLIAEGYQVTKAASGREALEHVAREDFDCVMVDLIMPRMDGIEVCRRISAMKRNHVDGQSAAVVMLTASETQEDMTRCLEAGADDFVGKSSDVAVLKARIRALLRRKFFQEENQRIIEELKNKELAALRSRAEREAELHNALKQAYDDLRMTQDAVLQQERLRALGQMASGIAHDINNAISPVALYTETLLEREPNLSNRTRQYLQIIQRAIDDVAHTVGRMREFYRLREPELILAKVDLNVLVPQVADLTRARWSDMPQQRGVVIRVDTELEQRLPQIAGVESEIREALTNLIFNAVDAMPDGGRLTLRTRTVDGSVLFEISDTGTGMDERTRQRCFEPFFTNKGERGTGLGLAMVYGVVQRHSAKVEIETALGTGTTFRLIFQPAVNSHVEQPAELIAQPATLEILMADDDQVLASSLRDALEMDGHRIVTAAGGQEAIDLFRNSVEAGRAFDVVITDLGMPYIDGRRVASVVKLISPGTPVFLLTGWGQKLVAEGDIPPGVDRVLNKPPKLRELRAALAAIKA
jgi:DNA-binding response OmpR family regulator/anti-sigma regulatory factor (Ser/Thr protein kinase)